MANWYIDRSRNISSILQSNYFHKLCDLATKEVNNYSSRELIDLLGIAEDMKNPNALLTFLRDIGLINANTNIPSNFLKVCVKSKCTTEEMILMIILKKNSEKNEKSTIKPFIMLCKAFSILNKNEYELKIHWNDCVNYIMKCDNYEQLDDSLIEEMLANRVVGKLEESAVLDIWFNAFCDTKLFEKDKDKFIKLKEEYIDLIEYFADEGEKLKCNLTREDGLKQMSDSTYGLYTMISNAPIRSIKVIPDDSHYFSYFKFAEEFKSKEQTMKKKINYKTGLNETKFKQNIILFGAPGTGKSYQLNNNKDELLGIGSNNYERVTFHPDYSYANFVGCYKPVSIYNKESKKKEIEYKYVPGPFMRTLVNALRSTMSEQPEIYLLIIEEINRANVAAVFGDIFQLLDRKNGISEYPIQTSEDMRQYLIDELGGEPDDYKEIRLPDNMFIWATMNSADQGVFPMDTAFKRRWNFTYLGINNNEEEIDDKFITIDNDQFKWNDVRKAINDYLSKMNINEDKLMGPFFINPKDINNDNFDEVFKNKVLMYLFEDAGKQRRNKLFKNNMNIYSEICKEYDKNKFKIFADEILQSIDDYQK